ncbi:hypothetical protein AB0M31_09495 [Streptomyces sp. NPDC051773]|uniref:winged helix-turn-helix transcriptional regulator n=1 Tax=Streptomyces sp. NPDC051773 TaxID=3156682 RepID=UPI003424FBD3
MSPLYEASADEPVVGVAVPVTVDDHERCPATALLRRIGDKWSPVLLSLLGERSYGFNELDRSVQGPAAACWFVLCGRWNAKDSSAEPSTPTHLHGPSTR